jgi:hypothetical protein
MTLSSVTRCFSWLCPIEHRFSPNSSHCIQAANNPQRQLQGEISPKATGKTMAVMNTTSLEEDECVGEKKRYWNSLDVEL